MRGRDNRSIARRILLSMGAALPHLMIEQAAGLPVSRPRAAGAHRQEAGEV
jgi:hypothetical protein